MRIPEHQKKNTTFRRMTCKKEKKKKENVDINGNIPLETSAAQP
jgi:hypothetical protein